MEKKMALTTERRDGRVMRRNGLCRVMYAGKITAPRFNSNGAALAYLAMLQEGRRKPEYERRDDT
jgi:hypothetical protein